MSNAFTYIGWRGDLTLEHAPFCEVDNLILAELSYIDWRGIVPGPGEGQISIRDAAARYFVTRPVPEPVQEDMPYTDRAIDRLLYDAASSRRFGGMMLHSFVAEEEADRQFSATSISVTSGVIYLSYRGTADGLTGWKEDFMLACAPQIPSHGDALAYLNRIAALYPDARLMPGGHSKGGNLAVYAAASADLALQSKITSVWSNDGPGFQQAFIDSEGYRRISGKLQCIVPKSSIVGMLLAHDENYRIVDSTQTGFLQHDGMSWQVYGDHFVPFPALTPQSIKADREIRSWLADKDMAERRQIVDAMFDMLHAAGASTVVLGQSDWVKLISTSLPKMRELDKNTRDQIVSFLVMLGAITSRLYFEDRAEKNRQRAEKHTHRR